MEPEEQKSSSDPSAMVRALFCKRAKLSEELRDLEKQVYDMETSYLQDSPQCGNVLKGFEGFLTSSRSSALFKRARKVGPEDRAFSLSSITSPATEEHAAAREAGVLLTNGPGKPKRGRGGGPRSDGRRNNNSRQISDPDFEYDEDDPDVTL